MTAARPIPQTYDDLVAQYNPLVEWVIARTARSACRRHQWSPEEAEDLRQHVYEVMLRRDYLARCQAYLAKKGSGSMTSSLYVFVKRVAMNYFRDQRVRDRYENTAYDENVKPKVVFGEGRHSDAIYRGSPSPFDLRDVATVRTIEAGIILDDIETKLDPELREALRACRLEGEFSARAVRRRLPRKNGKSTLRSLQERVQEIHAAPAV